MISSSFSYYVLPTKDLFVEAVTMKDPARTVREREQREREAAAKTAAETQATVDRERAELLPQVRREIRAALARLEQLDYPGGRVCTPPRGLFTRPPEYVLWHVCASDTFRYPSPNTGDEVTGHIELSSDGELYARKGRYSYSTESLSPRELSRALAALQKFGVSRYIA